MKLKTLPLIFAITTVANLSFAQEWLISPYAGPTNLILVSASKSEYGLDDTITVTIIVSSEMDEFIPPQFEHFTLVSGPDYDAQFENEHQALVQREYPERKVFKMTYELRPQNRGYYILPCPKIELDGRDVECQSATIKVIEGT